MTTSNPYATPSGDIAPLPGGVDTTNPFDPKGRFTRLSWLAWTLVLSLLLGLVIFALAAIGLIAVPTPGPNNPAPIYTSTGFLLPQILFLVIYLVLSIRRFHDINASGWWTLLLIVPIANLAAWLVLLFKRGNEGANRFGPPRPTPGWERVVGIIYISLIVLAAVVGIIAAIAFPAYQDYLTRAAVHTT